MKIGSMDAAVVSLPINQNADSAGIAPDTKDSKNNLNNTLLDVKNISQLTEFEKSELPVPEKIVINAIAKANKALEGYNRRLEYSVHHQTKDIMVKVINSDTNEVVREFPPEKILDMVAKMWEMAGLIVDERR